LLKWRCCLLLLLFSPWLCAKTTLSVLAGLDKPPYINLTDQSGYELDLLRQVFHRIGAEAVFLHVPNARLRDLLLEGKADVASLQKPDPAQPLFYSLPYVQYQNVVASMKVRAIQLRRLLDLQPYSVVAFHNARRLLGPDYEQSVNAVSNYQELANQSQQVQMLLMGRCDLVVADRNILNYYLTKTGRSIDELELARLLPVSRYHVAFRSQELRNKFDKALLEFFASDDFIQLQQQYFHQLNQPFSPAVSLSAEPDPTTSSN